MRLISEGFLKVNNIIDTKSSEEFSKKILTLIKNDGPVFDKTRGWYWGLYKPPFLEEVMREIKPLMENISGVKLLSTYWFTTIYTNNSYLKIHTDRPSCEFSLSLNLKSEIDWPLFFKDRNNVEHEFLTEVGSGIAYLGREIPHWRAPLISENRQFFIQSFFHYVNADGPYKSFENDNNGTYKKLTIEKMKG